MRAACGARAAAQDGAGAAGEGVLRRFVLIPALSTMCSAALVVGRAARQDARAERALAGHRRGVGQGPRAVCARPRRVARASRVSVPSSICKYI